jgi:hypothetical protein
LWQRIGDSNAAATRCQKGVIVFGIAYRDYVFRLDCQFSQGAT